MGRRYKCVQSVLSMVGAVCLVCSMGTAAGAQSVTAVPKLDLNQLTGTWYEIGRYPNKREDKRCVGNATMLVALGDKSQHFQLVDTCKTKAGYTDAINIDGKAQTKIADGRLKVGFWPLYRKFWVLAVGPESAWALIGSPNHKDLWIYSKATTLTPEVLAEVEAKAVGEGFSMDKLKMTTQGLSVTE